MRMFKLKVSLNLNIGVLRVQLEAWQLERLNIHVYVHHRDALDILQMRVQLELECYYTCSNNN